MQARIASYRGYLALACAVALVAAALSSFVTAQPPASDQVEPDRPAEPPMTQLLGGADRYQTHLSTDKPIYRGGETVYIRGVVLHAADHTPMPAATPAIAEIEIKGPKGDTVARGALSSEDSVLGFAWDVPDDQAGGEYTIHVAYPWQGFAPAERSFDIRQYRAPRLKTQIVFVRDGYGPGDTVNASVNITRAEGGVPTDATITAVARVDGNQVHRGPVSIDDQGNASASFKLPERIERGAGTLAFVIEDGGVVETAAKTIPILLQTIDLQMYPEGGDLVQGIESRVYLDAKLPNGKPADLAGVIEAAPANVRGRVEWTEVAEVRTEHEGRGRFVFTPRANKVYRLRITRPSGIGKTFDLPTVKTEGCVLSAKKDVYGPEEPIAMSIDMPNTLVDRITVRKQEKRVGEARPGLHAPATGTDVSIDVPAGIDGVLVVTAYDKAGKPLAERLVFRKPAQQINIDITASKDRYVPGEDVELTIKATDPDGKPVEAVVGLTVTDDSVLEMIDKREQAPRLPVMVLLEPDVRDLADAHVYLDPQNEQAELATDLLLGTQGWRRFALVKVADFVKAHGLDAKRALALRHPDPRRQHEWLRGPGDRVLRFDNKGNMQLRKNGERWREAGEVDAARVPMSAAALVPDEPGAVFGARGGAAPDAAFDAPPEEGAGAGGEAPGDDGGNLEDLGPARQQLAEAADLAEAKENADRLVAPSREALDREELDPNPARARNDFLVIREFAHQVRPDRRPGQRIDFAETLYFHAGIRTDAKTGQATVSFGLCDAVTGFRVLADGFTQAGVLGSADTLIESVEPFYIEPKMPLELTSGDRVDLPLAVVNGTADPLDAVRLSIVSDEQIGARLPEALAVAGDQRVRTIIPIHTGGFVGQTDFTVAARAGGFADSNTRQLRVMPLGFPMEIAFGGMIEPASSVVQTVVIPEDRVEGSIATDIRIMPSPVANMTTAMERLIREPHGCFEQTSSTNYPLVMAQQYFTTHQGVDPNLIARSARTLDKGYQRLVSFECHKRGYEWFGEDPGHEALTAYGLMEFVDMADVMQVDREMIAMTRKWLMDQRDGEGGFKRGRRALHTWIVDKDCSDGYILWSLLSTGTKAATLKKEIDSFREAAGKSDNRYVTALAANVMHEAGDHQGRDMFIDRLCEAQQKDGHIAGATTSIVGSGGQALKIETTALAQLAMLHRPDVAGNVEKAHQWLAEQCEGGRYGSTQSTVLAIKAVVAYNESRAAPAAPGRVVLLVDGEQVGQPVAFDADAKDAFEMPRISDYLTPGEHTIELRMEDGSRMPYAISVTFNRTRPDSAEACKLRLGASLNDTTLTEGNITEARVSVHNITDQTVPTPVAIIGIPGGLEVRHDQLKELREAGTIAAYEVIGREVVLYWRELKAGQKVELPLSLVAAVPGAFTAPASRAYLYYTDEHKQWIEPLSATIKPR